MPRRKPTATAWARERDWSFARRWRTWDLTVSSERKSRWPISRFTRPSRDQLEHLDLAHRRLLLELPKRALERDDLGAVAGTAPRRRPPRTAASGSRSGSGSPCAQQRPRWGYRPARSAPFSGTSYLNPGIGPGCPGRSTGDRMGLARGVVRQGGLVRRRPGCSGAAWTAASVAASTFSGWWQAARWPFP